MTSQPLVGNGDSSHSHLVVVVYSRSPLKRGEASWELTWGQQLRPQDGDLHFLPAQADQLVQQEEQSGGDQVDIEVGHLEQGEAAVDHRLVRAEDTTTTAAQVSHIMSFQWRLLHYSEILWKSHGYGQVQYPISQELIWGKMCKSSTVSAVEMTWPIFSRKENYFFGTDPNSCHHHKICPRNNHNMISFHHIVQP